MPMVLKSGDHQNWWATFEHGLHVYKRRTHTDSWSPVLKPQNERFRPSLSLWIRRDEQMERCALIQQCLVFKLAVESIYNRRSYSKNADSILRIKDLRHCVCVRICLSSTLLTTDCCHQPGVSQTTSLWAAAACAVIGSSASCSVEQNYNKRKA